MYPFQLNRYIQIYKNGASWNAAGTGVVRLETAPTTDHARLAIYTAIVEVTAGDYFELMAYQNSGGALSTIIGVGATWFSMELVK